MTRDMLLAGEVLAGAVGDAGRCATIEVRHGF